MNITIGRYPVPTETERAELFKEHPNAEYPSDRWESYIEPEDSKWILFVGVDGDFAFWPKRDKDGGVIGEPITE